MLHQSLGQHLAVELLEYILVLDVLEHYHLHAQPTGLQSQGGMVTGLPQSPCPCTLSGHLVRVKNPPEIPSVDRETGKLTIAPCLLCTFQGRAEHKSKVKNKFQFANTIYTIDLLKINRTK